MKSKEQLLLASDLGRAAFHAGRPCSLAKDKDFQRFLLLCGDWRVDASPTGEAPTLTLLDAWITQWRQEEQNMAASPASVAPPAALVMTTKAPPPFPDFHDQVNHRDDPRLRQGDAL